MASMLTRTVTVNAAFLQEIKDDNRELHELIEQLHQMFAQQHWNHHRVRDLADACDQLRDQLAMHFSLEEAYGYFEDAVQQAPRLCDKAERLQAEHSTLYIAASNLAEDAEKLLYSEDGAVGIGRLERQFDALYLLLEDHESREQDLILAAFDEDIGVGD